VREVSRVGLWLDSLLRHYLYDGGSGLHFQGHSD
jgi:hypothetical protein